MCASLLAGPRHPSYAQAGGLLWCELDEHVVIFMMIFMSIQPGSGGLAVRRLGPLSLVLWGNHDLHDDLERRDGVWYIYTVGAHCTHPPGTHGAYVHLTSCIHCAPMHVRTPPPPFAVGAVAEGGGALAHATGANFSFLGSIVRYATEFGWMGTERPSRGTSGGRGDLLRGRAFLPMRLNPSNMCPQLDLRRLGAYNTSVET